MDGVDHAEVDLASGEAEILPKKGGAFDPLQIPKVIEDAGFSVREILITAGGQLSEEGEYLQLQVPGLDRPFVLAGGAKVEDLKSRGELKGKEIQITGKLHPSHGPERPGLTVESFEGSR